MTHWTSCENQWIHDLQDVIVDYRCFPCIFLMILVIYYYMAVNLYTFSVAVVSSLPSIFSALLEDSMNLYTFFCSGIFPASEYLFRWIYTLFFVAVLSPLPSIFSALLEDSLVWSYFPRVRESFQRSSMTQKKYNFNEVLLAIFSLSRVSAQIVQISMI